MRQKVAHAQGRPVVQLRQARFRPAAGLRRAGRPSPVSPLSAPNRGQFQLLNRSGDEVVYLEVGERTPGDAVTCPDDDLQAVVGDDGRWSFRHKDATPYRGAGARRGLRAGRA